MRNPFAGYRNKCKLIFAVTYALSQKHHSTLGPNGVRVSGLLGLDALEHAPGPLRDLGVTAEAEKRGKDEQAIQSGITSASLERARKLEDSHAARH